MQPLIFCNFSDKRGLGNLPEIAKNWCFSKSISVVYKLLTSIRTYDEHGIFTLYTKVLDT